MASKSILKGMCPNKTGLFCKYKRKSSEVRQPVETEWRVMRKNPPWRNLEAETSKRLCQIFLPERHNDLLEPANSCDSFSLFFFLTHPLHFLVMNFKDSSHTVCTVITTEGSLILRQLSLCERNLEFTKAQTLVRKCRGFSHLKAFWMGSSKGPVVTNPEEKSRGQNNQKDAFPRWMAVVPESSCYREAVCT